MVSRRTNGQAGHRVVVTGCDRSRAAALCRRLVEHDLEAHVAGSEAAVIELLRTTTGPWTVLYDLGPTDPSPWEVLLRLQREQPAPAVVVAAAEPMSGHVDLCLLAGARTVVHTGDSDAALVAAVDSARRQDLAPPDIATRRRRALRQLARTGAGDRQQGADAAREAPGGRRDVAVRLSALERPAVPAASTDRQRQRFLALGPAQQALVAGLVRGASVQSIADERGVSASAIYAAKRRLVARLDIQHGHLTEELRQRFGRLVSSDGSSTGDRSQDCSTLRLDP